MLFFFIDGIPISSQHSNKLTRCIIADVFENRSSSQSNFYNVVMKNFYTIFDIKNMPRNSGLEKILNLTTGKFLGLFSPYHQIINNNFKTAQSIAHPKWVIDRDLKWTLSSTMQHKCYGRHSAKF